MPPLLEGRHSYLNHVMIYKTLTCCSETACIPFPIWGKCYITKRSRASLERCTLGRFQ